MARCGLEVVWSGKWLGFRLDVDRVGMFVGSCWASKVRIRRGPYRYASVGRTRHQDMG